MNEQARLKEFYIMLDATMTENVWEIENSIADGEQFEQPTKENTFDKIYKQICSDEHLKFLGKTFIQQEINKYFDIENYWAEVRNKYELN